MKLIFDTETTGLAKFNLPLNDRSQPRLVQLGCIIVDDEFNSVAEFVCIVKPEGFSIPTQASNIHGITDAMAAQVGLRLTDVVRDTFGQLLSMADTLIAHNLKFDLHVLQVDNCIANLGWEFKNKYQYCTMLESTSICKIPSARGGYKWPKLTELYRYLFGRDFEGAHNALHDCRATLECYKELMRRKNMGPADRGSARGIGDDQSHGDDRDFDAKPLTTNIAIAP